MDPEKTAQKPQTSRRIKWILCISLAFNLAIAGLIIGASFRHDKDGARLRVLRGHDFGFAPYIAAFEHEDRKEIARAYMKENGGLRHTRKEIRLEFKKILTALEAQTFYPEGFKALLQAQQSNLAERQKIGLELIYYKIVQMDPQERAQLAKRLDERLRHKPRSNP